MTDGRKRRRRGRRGAGPPRDAAQPAAGDETRAPAPEVDDASGDRPARRDTRRGRGEPPGPPGSDIRRGRSEPPGPPGPPQGGIRRPPPPEARERRPVRDDRGRPRPAEPQRQRGDGRRQRDGDDRPRGRAGDDRMRSFEPPPPPDPRSVELGAAFREAQQAVRDARKALDKRKAEYGDEPEWLTAQLAVAERRFAEAADEWSRHLETTGRKMARR